MMIALAKRFGADFILPTIAEREKIDSAAYSAGTPGIAAAPALAGDERSHARLLGVIAAKGVGGMEGGALAQLEGRHRAVGGNALRAAVLGANDGLVSNLSLVMGVAGAQLSGSSILVTGLAGLLAGAGSMALGEWLSVQSARELFQHQIEIETAELEADPEEERRELELIYRAKGLDEEASRKLADQLVADPARAIEALAREELGVDPKELGGSAWVAAITSFVLFAVGAVIPVIPYGVLEGPAAFWTSIVASAFGLFGIGALITLMTGRSVWFSGLRQLLFGLVAAALTFGVGHLIGVSLAG
jgi:VIT1/CCC1 family predicted Fe2+/Mn2+ transporter